MVYVGFCSDRVFHLQAQARSAQIAFFEFRKASDEMAEGGFRSDCVAVFMLGYGFIEDYATVFGLHFKRAVIVGYGFGVFALVLSSHTSDFIGFGDERVAFKRESGIFFSSAEVIKVELGHSTVEIRLGLRGVDAYDLVEILDRKYVVFKVVGIGADPQHLFGVDLSADVCRA